MYNLYDLPESLILYAMQDALVIYLLASYGTLG